MLVPPVESLLPQLCNGQLKHVVLFGIEVGIQFLCMRFSHLSDICMYIMCDVLGNKHEIYASLCTL